MISTPFLVFLNRSSFLMMVICVEANSQEYVSIENKPEVTPLMSECHKKLALAHKFPPPINRCSINDDIYVFCVTGEHK